MTKVLGLGLSLTATGACLVQPGLLSDSAEAGERWLLKTSSEVADMDRYEYIARTVVGIVFGQESSAVVDVVAMEGVYASRNLQTFGRLTALAAVVQYALHRSQVPYVVLAPNAWRTAVFGPPSRCRRSRASRLRSLSDLFADVDLPVNDFAFSMDTRVMLSQLRVLLNLPTEGQVIEELVRQAMPSRNGHAYEVVCFACGKKFTVDRRPVPGRRSWCNTCKADGEPAAQRARDYRERHPKGL